MALSKKDKLNNLSMSYEQYFGEMALDEQEINERISLAQELEDVFLGLFLEVDITQETEEYDRWDEFEDRLYSDVLRIGMAFLGITYITAALNDYASQLATNITNTTRQNMGVAWYTSLDRARYDAENEANSIGNYRQQVKAINQGYTQKTWVTMQDNRVRHTHVEVDGETIGIFDYFEVGNSKMLYPKDANGSGEEVINCRCTCEYS